VPTNAEIVKDMLDSFNRGDFEHAMSLFADDVEFVEPESLPYGGVYRGTKGFEELAKGMSETWTYDNDFEHTVYDAGGDTTFHTGNLNATSNATGKRCELPFVEKSKVVDGKVKQVVIYISDTAAVLEACGITPAASNS
jgi:ketosteroid isomerase-like protein